MIPACSIYLLHNQVNLVTAKKPHPTHFSVGFQTCAIMRLFILLFSCHIELTMEKFKYIFRRDQYGRQMKAQIPTYSHVQTKCQNRIDTHHIWETSV